MIRFVIIFIAVFIFIKSAYSQDINEINISDYDQITCLAKNIFFEARGESEAGKLAVGAVTINRSEKSGRSICYEVYKPKQFSWTHLYSQHRQVKKIEREQIAYNKIFKMATNLFYDLSYKDQSGIGKRDHFLNPKIVIDQYGQLPRYYRKNGYSFIKVGRHIFYEVVNIKKRR